MSVSAFDESYLIGGDQFWKDSGEPSSKDFRDDFVGEVQ